MFKFGEMRYLPLLNYHLTPFGSEYELCNNFRYKDKLLAADIGLGEKTFNDFYRLRFKCYNFVNTRSFKMNAHMEIWNQPELLLKSNTVSRGNLNGGLIKVDLMLNPFKYQNTFSLFSQVGYKSKGFSIGEPLDQTLIFRYGLSLHL